jgi:hypothetical protein
MTEIMTAWSDVIRGWLGVFPAVVGLGMIVWGGALLKILGLVLLALGYIIFVRTTERRLIVAKKAGGFIEFKVEKSELAENVAASISKAIRDRQRTNDAALRAELDSLPSAR